MSLSSTLDLEKLVAPISEEQPVGLYLKESNYMLLQKAKDARAMAIAAEKKARELALYSAADLEMIPAEDLQVAPPDWRTVHRLCVDVLTNHSKDLWIASWLIEATVRVDGFAGLRDGFLLVARLVDEYWGQLYPPRDEDEDYLDTVSQINSLNGDSGAGTLIFPIECLPLFPGSQYTGLTTAAYRQATESDGGDVTESEFHSAARQIEQESLRQYNETIVETLHAYESMITAIETKLAEEDCDSQVPSSTQIRGVLGTCERLFSQITRDVLDHPGSSSTDHSEQAMIAGENTPASAALATQGQVTNREDAFRMLLRASEFFRKTEPHSPVSYMLQQAVRFGRMELPDLLQELIQDDDVLARFAERTGIEIKKGRDD